MIKQSGGKVRKKVSKVVKRTQLLSRRYHEVEAYAVTIIERQGGSVPIPRLSFAVNHVMFIEEASHLFFN